MIEYITQKDMFLKLFTLETLNTNINKNRKQSDHKILFKT